jgi:aminopeptidase N
MRCRFSPANATAVLLALALAAGCRPASREGTSITLGEQPTLDWAEIGIVDYSPSPAQRRFDVRHYGLKFAVDPEGCAIRAEATIRGRKEPGLAALELDFYDNLVVRAVTSDGRPLVHERPGRHKLRVTLPDPAAATFCVTVAYEGRPYRIESNSGWQCGLLFAEVDGRPVINTCFQPFFARSLFPAKDHPSDKAEEGVDITVTVPAPLRVVATGHRVRVETAEGRRTEHWRTRYAVATNLISFAASEFVELVGWYETCDGRKLRLQHFVRPEHAGRAREAFAELPRVLRIYEARFGPYPFPDDKLAMVETSYSGLENQTAIAYGTSYPESKPGRGEYDYVLVHETAHEWAGNAVTCRDWRDIWLHEGIASYAEGLYLEARDGRDMYLALARTWQAKASADALTDRDPNSDDDIFDSAVVYNRAPAVLHMLRFCLGDEAFLAGLKDFLTDPALRYGNADTATFRRHLERAAGRDLTAFFRAWVHGGGFFEAEYEAVESGGKVVVAVRSVSGGREPHRLPLVVRLEANGRRLEQRAEVGPEGTVFRFSPPGGPWRVVFDPEGWLLRGDIRPRPGLCAEIERR